MIEEHIFGEGNTKCVDGDKKLYTRKNNEQCCGISCFKTENGCSYLNQTLVIQDGYTSASTGSKPVEYFGCDFKKQ